MSIRCFSAAKNMAFVALFVATLSVAAIAATSDHNMTASAEALTLIADFSDRLCTKIPLDGSKRDIKLAASVNAELLGLLKKLTNLGVNFSAKYNNSEYQGLLQQDLAGYLREREACKLKIWTDLKDRLLPQMSVAVSTPPARPNPTALLLRTARILPGVSRESSILEIIVENPSSKPIAVTAIFIEGSTGSGVSCAMGSPPNPWQPLSLNWQSLMAHLPEEETAVWTELADTPLRVESSLKVAHCGDYFHRLKMKIPVQHTIPNSGLSRITFRVTEEVPVGMFIKGLASWSDLNTRIESPNPVRPDTIRISRQ